MRKPTFWFPTWSDTNQAVHIQKMARGLKFRIKKVEGLYYLCSENKGADQLRGHREADLRLCFRICKMLVFSRRGSYVILFCSPVVPKSEPLILTPPTQQIHTKLNFLDLSTWSTRVGKYLCRPRDLKLLLWCLLSIKMLYGM